MVNKVILVGRLGRDPELRHTQNGQPVASLNLATDKSFKDKFGKWTKRTEWHSIVVWGKTGEAVANNLTKGSLAYVEGELQTRKYKDKSGQEKTITEINAQLVKFLEPKEQTQTEEVSDEEIPF